MTTTPYVDPVTLHNPATGTSPPASWGDCVRDGLEFLVRPPGCVLETTSDQSGASTDSTWYNVSWNAAVDLRDTDGFHTGTGDTITVPTGLGGWYHICGHLVWDADAAGTRMVRYSVNGAGDYRLAVVSPADGTVSTRVPFATDVLLSAGDVVRISGWQNSGGTLMIQTGCRVSMRLVAVS